MLACSPRKTEILQSLSPEELEALEYAWPVWARPNQLAPLGLWRTWLVQAGRGFGKTRCGSEWVRAAAERDGRERFAFVGATAADARDVMVEGESGILAVSPPWFRPIYEPSKRRLTWPNGARATLFSAEEPERLRGPQHTKAWCDETAAWFYPEAWDQLQFGLRLGAHPQCVVTTTPRPTDLIRRIIRAADTVVTRGSTFDNAANLAPSFLEAVRRKYEGTRLGRQELFAELLEDTPGALWTIKQLDALRVPRAPARYQRVVVAIDPSVTSTGESDECGIVVAGIGENGDGYVLDDLSGIMSPDTWAKTAIKAYRDYGADRIVAEVNNGGDMVEATLRTVESGVSYKAVHASRGKRIRAEPVAALYEQERVHHVGGFAKLEDQMTTWDASSDQRSPDRLDALVWALTELMLDVIGFESVRGTPRRRSI